MDDFLVVIVTQGHLISPVAFLLLPRFMDFPNRIGFNLIND